MCRFETPVRQTHIHYRLCLAAWPPISAEDEHNSSIMQQHVWEDVLVGHISGPLHTPSILLLQFLETRTTTNLPFAGFSSPCSGFTSLFIPRWVENSMWRFQSGQSGDSQHFLLLMICPFFSTLTRRRRERETLTAAAAELPSKDVYVN